MECVNIFHFVLYSLNLCVPFKLISLIKANQSVHSSEHAYQKLFCHSAAQFMGE